MSAEQLSDEMNAQGVPWKRTTVANIESGRRSYVTVEELFALAYVLNTSPLNLALSQVDDDAVQVTPRVQVSTDMARFWARGRGPMGSQNEVIYYTESPISEMSGGGR